MQAGRTLPAPDAAHLPAQSALYNILHTEETVFCHSTSPPPPTLSLPPCQGSCPDLGQGRGCRGAGYRAEQLRGVDTSGDTCAIYASLCDSQLPPASSSNYIWVTAASLPRSGTGHGQVLSTVCSRRGKAAFSGQPQISPRPSWWVTGHPQGLFW